jgi:hypothetical protein
MRRTRRRRDRHVLHGQFRLIDDARTGDAGPGAVAARVPLDKPEAVESPPDELAAIRARLDRDDLTVLAYRFEGDLICRAQRRAAYSGALGDRFVSRTLPDSAANADVSPFFAKYVPYPHSVVTQHLIDEAGQPTILARDEILAFFRHRLKG